MEFRLSFEEKNWLTFAQSELALRLSPTLGFSTNIVDRLVIARHLDFANYRGSAVLFDL